MMTSWLAKRTCSRRRGVTLVELLVVIAIIGLLVAILLPAVQQSREAARAMQCRSHLRQFGLAMHHYHDTYGRLPPSHSRWWMNQTTADGAEWSWGTFVLPYMEQGAIYDQLQPNDQTAPVALAKNLKLFQTPLSFHRCPSDSGGPITDVWRTYDVNGVFHYQARSNYLVSWDSHVAGAWLLTGTNGAFRGNSEKRFSDFTDGTSNSILIGERASVRHARRMNAGTIYAVPAQANGLTLSQVWVSNFAVGWPEYNCITNIDACRVSFLSLHPGGANFVFADASARFVSETIDMNADKPVNSTLEYFYAIADGNPASSF